MKCEIIAGTVRHTEKTDKLSKWQVILWLAAGYQITGDQENTIFYKRVK